MKYRIIAKLRESIRDNQGEAVKNVLHQMGFTNVKSVRIGKSFTFSGDGRKIKPEDIAKELVNPVMEDHTIEKDLDKKK